MNLGYLGVSGTAAANLAVAWVGRLAAGIAGDGLVYCRKLLKDAFDSKASLKEQRANRTG
ncbi:hypothetical protein HH1059_19970 [Halorhodospira halochloris]|uniref:Uncharacterized protein n=1 Tax=Halorhodospira halochloris TaxID=1052 RepID=A0A2Z6EZP4_HALHR|nr:hypothetical protein HH1059_19970 [Halorhodospira halochloris]